MGITANLTKKGTILKIKDHLIKNGPIIYKSINIEINTNNSKDYFNYLKLINFDFCKKFEIGPYFLCEIPCLFNKSYQNTATSRLLHLLKLIKYPKAEALDYKFLFTSDSILNLSKLNYNKLNEFIIDCPSMAFRILLYCVKLSFTPEIFFYSNIHKGNSNNTQKIKNQIELDIPRTCFKYDVLKQKEFITNFRTLLFEIACRDEELSYVQGMNFLAAFILMFTGNQLELSLILFTKILYLKSEFFGMYYRNCFGSNFSLLRNYTVKFKDMVWRYENEIYNKLEDIGNDYYLWVSKWIQTLFVLNFKFELAMKFWDIIISEGLDSVLVISISIVKFLEKDILKANYIEDLLLIIEKINSFTQNEYVKLFTFIEKNVKNHIYPI